MRHTISVLVENKFGVLTRVAGLFSGRFSLSREFIFVMTEIRAEVFAATLMSAHLDRCCLWQ
jgi:acetolactate synthase-1/3 small subunit